MEYVGRIELATPRLYHNDDRTPPHQNFVAYLDNKPSIEFVNLRTDLKIITKRKAAVVYHISRNGHFEHPHFLEVPLSFGKGLYLKDVINALNLIRGPGMANMYSWSSKRRSHGKGYVWKDLTENDLIQPCYDDGDNDHQYILKGSPVRELFSTWNLRSSADTLTSSTTSKESSDVEASSLSDDFDSPVIRGKSFGRGITYVDADGDADVDTDYDDHHRRDHKLPPPRTTTILTNEIDELYSEFPSLMDGAGGVAKKVDAKEAHRHHHETLRSAMMRTSDKVSPFTPPEPIARKAAAGRVGRPRTAELLWTLVRCGSRSMR